KDEQSDRTDDISEGQAVAGPSDASSIDATDPSSFEMPQYEKSLDFNTDPAIKNIEDKDGKRYTTLNLSNYAKQVNNATWSPNMNVNSAMTIKMQALLDWNYASPGPIDGGWGMNSKKALINFQTMKGLPATGTMDQKTWDALTKNIPANKPVLVTYTLTEDDIKTNFLTTPSGSEAKSKVKGLYYQDIKEMLAERFHMDIRYLDKLNKNKNYRAGETITVLNTRKPLNERINRVVADKASKTLYAYNDDKLVATYPTTIGSDA
ncbi:peptidoglycan-binding protein, partial [Psychrobacter sp. 1U2]